MIRPLFVTHTLDFEAGGAERVLYDILLRIDRSRFSPRVFVAEDPGGIPEAFRALGVPIEVGPRLAIGVPFGPRGIWNTVASLWSLMRSLSRSLEREKVDVVHVNSIFALAFALAACRRHGVPVVFHEHGLPRDRDGSPWSRRYAARIRKVAAVIAITDAVRNEVLSYGIDPERVTTVYNGIDPGGPSHDVQKRAGFSIVHVANFLEWKGQDILVDALAHLRETVPRANVTFFGTVKDPAYHAKVCERIETLDLKDAVVFGGFRPDLQSLLPAFDCLVVASRAEPFGLVLLEGMRAGLSIVASRAGGVPEIVENEENGLLFEAGDHRGLARALARVATQPEVTKALVERGRQVVSERFSFDAQLAGVEDVLEAAASGSPIRLARAGTDEKPE